MANVQQAAKWMGDGHRVIGGNSVHPIFEYEKEIMRISNVGPSVPYVMDMIDLLADDWELAD